MNAYLGTFISMLLLSVCSSVSAQTKTSDALLGSWEWKDYTKVATTGGTQQRTSGVANGGAEFRSKGMMYSFVQDGNIILHDTLQYRLEADSILYMTHPKTGITDAAIITNITTTSFNYYSRSSDNTGIYEAFLTAKKIKKP